MSLPGVLSVCLESARDTRLPSCFAPIGARLPTPHNQKHPKLIYTLKLRLPIRTLYLLFRSFTPPLKAVWTWAYALHDLLDTQGIDVATLTADNAGRTKLFNTLAKQDFYGASGRVHYDPVTGDRRGLPVKIENSVDGEEVVVGHFSPESGIKWDSSKPLVWHGSKLLNNSTDKNNGTNYVDTGDTFAPSDGSERVLEIKLSMWDDTANGFGFFKRDMAGNVSHIHRLY